MLRRPKKMHISTYELHPTGAAGCIPIPHVTFLVPTSPRPILVVDADSFHPLCSFLHGFVLSHVHLSKLAHSDDNGLFG